MSETLYTCVNCQLQFENEASYKEHYKSEHHRYNIKRKLICLPPLNYQDYLIQFQTELTSKSSSQREAFCDICSKKFMSIQTYKQHLESNKHKARRQQLLHYVKPLDRSMNSSSDFSYIGYDNNCLFCHEKCSDGHMLQQHNFPPFVEECVDKEGLVRKAAEIISQGFCLFCNDSFTTEDSARQHMKDVGHAMINLDHLEEFEEFYCWKIQEDSLIEEEEDLFSDEQAEEKAVNLKETYKEIEAKRLSRIQITPVGATINGREVGCRAFKKYYRQYLGRQIPAMVHDQKCLTNGEEDQSQNEWKLSQKDWRSLTKAPKIVHSVNHR